MALDDTSLEHLLSPEYTGALSSLGLDELRRRRQECQQVEVALSYVRRLAQGRLDIVNADLARREGGGTGADVHELVDKLADILSERVHSPGTGHLPMYMFPDIDELAAELDTVAGVDRLGALPALSDDEVREMARALEEHETLRSAQRRAVHQRIDLLQEELVDRYKRGDASPDDLLA